MCGINGLVSNSISNVLKEKYVSKMNLALAHRGPDNTGIWNNDEISLGQTRLSIIDLSDAGNQPFFSNDKRYVIVYNGELYNYKQIKLQLQQQTQGDTTPPYFFKTNTDTEVILAAYIKYGAECLNYFNGMFAFAIYDTELNKTFIARDRMGVKPLYYHYSNFGFIFSSELRGILKSELKKFELNTDYISEYFTYQTIHAPNTLVKGIKMLLPGHYIEFANNKAEITEYYNLKNKIEPFEANYKSTCNRVLETLSLSVQQRLVADVPFGAFLSGGIDSSAVVGLMSNVSSEKINTFNVSFDESEFSESKYARIIAEKFNTQHHEIKLTPQHFLNDLPEALSAMDHPSGDGPNTYIVSKATKNAGITMALSGIGGDELFAGYDVFKRMHSLQSKQWINLLPKTLRKGAAELKQLRSKTIANKKIAELMAQPQINFKSAYPLSRAVFTQSEISELLTYTAKAKDSISNLLSEIEIKDNFLFSAVSYVEIKSYLQNVLLRDTDQMSMAVALEVREPFLDYNLIELALSINDRTKFPHSPKKLLVDSLSDLLPNEIVNRPKMGFTLPWQFWLKNELKTFAEKNITELAHYNFCKKNAVLNLWHRFLNNDPTVTWSRLWHLIVLNSWIDKNKTYLILD